MDNITETDLSVLNIMQSDLLQYMISGIQISNFSSDLDNMLNIEDYIFDNMSLTRHVMKKIKREERLKKLEQIYNLGKDNQ